MKLFAAFSLVLLFFYSLPLLGQPAPLEDELAALNAPTAIGITILGNPSLSIGSTNDYTNGVTINHNTLQISVSLGLSWSLQVRATDDLRFQNYSIPASSIALKSQSIGTRSEIFLRTTNQTLASGLATSILNAIMPITYRTIGGSTFLVPGGTYTTTLVFSYSAL